MEPPTAGGFWSGSRARWTIVAALVVGLAAFGIYAAFAGIEGSSAAEEHESPPAQVEPLGPSGVSRVVLSPEAAERLGIKTEPVRTAVVSKQRRQVIPYAAVVYEANGVAWTYTNPEALTFIRQRLTIDRIAGGLAVLSAGPRAGTRVVTVGAAELFGTEFEFDEE